MKPLYPCVMSLTYVWWSLTRMCDVSFFTYVWWPFTYAWTYDDRIVYVQYEYVCTCEICLMTLLPTWWPFTYVCTYVFDDLLPTNGDPLPMCNVPLLSCDPITYMLCGIHYMCCVKSHTMQYSSYVGTRSERWLTLHCTHSSSCKFYMNFICTGETIMQNQLIQNYLFISG